ncbi:MAG: hypothetical protein AAGH65_04310 [Pseudomonadota bacterium]
MLIRSTFAALLIGFFCAQTAWAQADRNPDGLSVHFTASANADGSCQPERAVLANAEGLGLYAVRGETVFSLPEGNTVIPFQSVFNAFDDDGYASDRSISVLNATGPCSDLTITVTIEYCEYSGSAGYEERACPDIQVTGMDGFAGIQFIRADQSSD